MNNANKNVIIILIIITIIVGLIALIFINGISIFKNDDIKGIENYNKESYIKKYGGDLDSNLSIFPDDKSILLNPKFSSSFSTGLFDTDGYILLESKFSEENFNKEVERLSKLNIVVKSSCYKNAEEYNNYIKYDELSYSYPAYIAIDGFGHTYEYALINEEEFEITYVYLSYPNVNDNRYNKYLKKDKSEYSKTNMMGQYSIYNHSFDDGKSYMEFDDCE